MKMFAKYSLSLLLILSLLSACKKDQSSTGCISTSISAAVVNQSITFTDCSSGAISAAWDFGDGTTGAGVITTKIYSAIGSYVVTLISTTTGGQTTTTKKTIVVSTVPSAVFTEVGCGLYPTSNTSLFVNGSLKFSSTPGATSYLWNFGDGSTSRDSTPQHIFTQVGTFTVKLTASNSLGADSSTQTITVVAPYYAQQFLNSTNNAGVQAMINSVNYTNGGSMSIDYRGNPYELGFSATITSAPDFIIPSQTIYANGTYQVVIHGHGTTLNAGTCSQSILIVDTVVGATTFQVLIDTLK